MAVDADLIQLLVCPACHGRIEYKPRRDLIICTGCGLHYPVRDDIPIMLVDEAFRPENRRSRSDRRQEDPDENRRSRSDRRQDDRTENRRSRSDRRQEDPDENRRSRSDRRQGT